MPLWEPTKLPVSRLPSCHALVSFPHQQSQVTPLCIMSKSSPVMFLNKDSVPGRDITLSRLTLCFKMKFIVFPSQLFLKVPASSPLIPSHVVNLKYRVPVEFGPCFLPHSHLPPSSSPARALCPLIRSLYPAISCPSCTNV